MVDVNVWHLRALAGLVGLGNLLDAVCGNKMTVRRLAKLAPVFNSLGVHHPALEARLANVPPAAAAAASHATVRQVRILPDLPDLPAAQSK